MARIDPQFRLRLPTNLLSQIKAEASASNRTINAEIVDRLSKSFASDQQLDRIEAAVLALAEKAGA